MCTVVVYNGPYSDVKPCLTSVYYVIGFWIQQDKIVVGRNEGRATKPLIVRLRRRSVSMEKK